MASNDPIEIARSVIYTQLYGNLNNNLSTECLRVNIPAIQFGLTDIYQAQIDYKVFEKSGNPPLQFISLYGKSYKPAPVPNKLPAYGFSGNVELAADVFFVLQSPRIEHFEIYYDAVGSAMQQTVNPLTAQATYATAQVVYNRTMGGERKKPAMDGSNWVLEQHFTIEFKVYC